MSTIGFKTPYSGSRYRVSLECGPGLAQQHFKDECDVNNILRKYQKTGLIDHVNRFQGDYADLSDVPDFQDSLNAVIDAQEAFMTLPSSIRKQFGNDPAAFLDFVHDPDNRDEMVKMGLSKAPTGAPNSNSLDVTVRTDTTLAADTKGDNGGTTAEPAGKAAQ
jgi:phage internal scaffolding protein